MPDFLPYIDLGSGISVFPAHDKAIDRVLAELAQEIPAALVLLTDMSGQIISVQGERGNMDLVALGLLVAGDLVATQKIARITGERQDYQMVLRESQETHTLISGAGPHLALFVQTSSDVPLGWARTLIQEAGRRLAEIILKLPDELERPVHTANTSD